LLWSISAKKMFQTVVGKHLLPKEQNFLLSLAAGQNKLGSSLLASLLSKAGLSGAPYRVTGISLLSLAVIVRLMKMATRAKH